MLEQAFSPNTLAKLVQYEDVARFRMWRFRPDRHNVLRQISATINDANFAFPVFREKSMRSKKVYAAPNATVMLALRKLEKNIRAIYKVKQANRDDIIHQTKSLLREGCAFTVLRLDIQSFYETINRDKIVAQIERDSILSYTSRVLLRKLLSVPQFASLPGVPRGLGISATLAELYLRDFDRYIRSRGHVYFYGRYVDDIIIFTHASAASAEVEVSDELLKCGLALNPDKKAIVHCFIDNRKTDLQTNGFDFLGYHFNCRSYLSNNREWREVSVGIAPSKIKKIKSRIVHAFVDHAIKPDFVLLVRRLKFLAGNYVLRGTKDSGLCGGIYYNYHHITDTRDLDNLDNFLRRLIFARRGSLGKRLHHALSDQQRRELLKIGFTSAFTRRITTCLPWGDMMHLRKCWIYEKN